MDGNGNPEALFAAMSDGVLLLTRRATLVWAGGQGDGKERGLDWGQRFAALASEYAEWIKHAPGTAETFGAISQHLRLLEDAQLV